MSYIALYRKWRPLVFSDVVEQEHVVKTIKNSISSNRIAHAYLFCGTRGTGKTTMAKIFSRAINCLNPQDGDPCNSCEICTDILAGNMLDVLEIDAASNNSVDNIREIRNEVIYTPSRAKYKVYIIDEVHMLSTGAFNALLKTLEEPPSHVVFILATTEPHKLPVTILSRCQRFDFRRIPTLSIVKRLEMIAISCHISLENDAALIIAKMADGALRDAISILDQCIALGSTSITYGDVLSVVGIVQSSFIADMMDAILNKDINLILQLINELIMDGKDISHFLSDLIVYHRNLLLYSIGNNYEDIIDFSEEIQTRMKNQYQKTTKDGLIYCIKELSALESSLKWSAHPRVLLEVAIIKLCETNSNSNNQDILERLNHLEKIINNPVLLNSLSSKGSKNDTSSLSSAENKSATSSSTKPQTKVNPIKIQPLEIWNDVLIELKKNGRMSLYTNLFDTKLIEIDNKILGVFFENKCNTFNKMFVSKAENLEVLEDTVAKLLGREIKLKCVSEDDLNSNNKGLQPIKDELIETAQKMASKLNVPLNIIDD